MACDEKADVRYSKGDHTVWHVMRKLTSGTAKVVTLCGMHVKRKLTSGTAKVVTLCGMHVMRKLTSGTAKVVTLCGMHITRKLTSGTAKVVTLCGMHITRKLGEGLMAHLACLEWRQEATPGAMLLVEMQFQVSGQLKMAS